MGTRTTNKEEKSPSTEGKGIRADVTVREERTAGFADGPSRAGVILQAVSRPDSVGYVILWDDSLTTPVETPTNWTIAEVLAEANRARQKRNV